MQIPTTDRWKLAPAHQFVDNLIKTELANGKYIIADGKPHCVHALGAVPKKESHKYRPITDCKRPIGSSINHHMSSIFKEFCYTTVDKVIDLIKPGFFMASRDIASAYRSTCSGPPFKLEIPGGTMDHEWGPDLLV